MRYSSSPGAAFPMPRPCPRLLLLLLLLLLLHLATCYTAAFGPADREPVDVRTATAASLRAALEAGATSCRAVVEAHLARIEALNPVVNAITGLDAGALDAADAVDAAVASGNVTGRPLLCVPVLLKDNFDAAGAATAAGCLALRGNRAVRDAPVVAALRAAGAIVLGRASMHEMALEGLSASSLAGQVRNPYDVQRTPGGSSGGSGAAVAASFAVLATGTDTVNSLRNPASANGLYSFRPTRGLISREGIVPVSETQDAVGAMARTVEDLTLALEVMASEGESRDYMGQMLHGTQLAGLRIGVVAGFFNSTVADQETTPVNNAMNHMASLLQDAGVAVVNITDPVFDAASILANLDLQRFEYREQLDSYLGGLELDHQDSPGVPRSFDELYNSGRKDFFVLPYQYDFIALASTSSTSDDEYKRRQEGVRALTQALAAVFDKHGLDAMVYPQQKNLVVKVGSHSQAGRNGILAALTGYPVVVAPAGHSDGGVPIGMEILGKPWSEGKLLGIAKGISGLAGAPVWTVPRAVSARVEMKAYAEVPVVVPDQDSMPSEYKLGTLGPPIY